MRVIKKWVLQLGMLGNIMLLAHGIVHAKNKPISLQQAMEIALKDNLNIQIAKSTRKETVLSNKLFTAQTWVCQATFNFMQENEWAKESKKFYFRAEPIFSLKWEFLKLFDMIFNTKIRNRKNILAKLSEKRTVDEALQQVVTCYYDLASEQKKAEQSNTSIKIATASLKIAEEKCRLGLVSRIDCFNAELALKQAKLILLEQQEALKEKRRNLNFQLGKSLNEEIFVEMNISIQPTWDITVVTKEKIVDLSTAIQAQEVAIAATELTKVKSFLLSCLSISSTLASDGCAYDLKNNQWNKQQSGKKSIIIGANLDIGSLLFMPAEIRKAKMKLDKEKLKLTQAKLTVENNLEDKRWRYRHAIKLYKGVEAQLKLSKQKLALEKERYRLNQIKLLEWQEAEEKVQQIEIKLIEQAFKVKKSEFELYRLTW